MKNNKKAFTLIELLVVITIIGLLAALAVPAIGSALARAKQAADVANVRQLGLIMFTIANDENGTYPTGPLDSNGTRTVSGSAAEFYNGLLTNKEISDPKIVWSSIAKPVTNFSFSSPGLVGGAPGTTNFAFSYVQGLTTSISSLVPLFVSYGAFADASGLSGTTIATGNNVWGDKGVTAYTVGNSAFWTGTTGSGSTAKLKNAFYSSTDVTLNGTVLLK